MEELLGRLEGIERQNEEILSLLRTMKAAEQLRDAIENMKMMNGLNKPYIESKRLVKVK